MNKNNVIDILGDLTWFISLLILQANNYEKVKTKKDSLLMSKMLQKLCNDIGLDELEITAIIARADDKLNNTLNKVKTAQEEEE